MGIFESLYHCVQTRPRPEDVIELVLEALGSSLRPVERNLLCTASRTSLKQMAWQYSSMASDFQRPVGADRQVSRAAELFEIEPLDASDCLEPARVEGFVRAVSQRIGKTYGKSDFLKDRFNREERVAAGLPKGHRWYNKRFRLLRRMEDKIRRMVWNGRKYALTRAGKSALAIAIPFEDFAKDLNTACFVAYLAANMSRRSVFTNTSQDRAYDKVADALFQRCSSSPTTEWRVIAFIMPDEMVLHHLSDEDKGQLLGATWDMLVDAADMLQTVFKGSRINLKHMIVHRGDDSSTWNQVAGGWNKAREHWISVLHALRMEGMLDEICPGKVLRLMAADVARWHHVSLLSKQPFATFEDSLHPDTKVWAELPRPWQVVRGRARCTRAAVEAACEKHGVSPQSWIGPRLGRKPVPFKPTPELVHGVAVSSPALAKALRKAGVFSAKSLKPDKVPEDFVVQRDQHGFALRADGAVPEGVNR